MPELAEELVAGADRIELDAISGVRMRGGREKEEAENESETHARMIMQKLSAPGRCREMPGEARRGMMRAPMEVQKLERSIDLAGAAATLVGYVVGASAGE